MHVRTSGHTTQSEPPSSTERFTLTPARWHTARNTMASTMGAPTPVSSTMFMRKASMLARCAPLCVRGCLQHTRPEVTCYSSYSRNLLTF